MADVKALEHPTLKVPYELLNKKFRSAQKNIDREISHLQIAGNDLEKCLQKKPVTVGEVTKALDSVVEKLTFLKRKADESINDELEAAQMTKRRVDHLKEYDSNQSNAVSLWKKTRLDRMLVEYFLRAGYYNAALRLAKHSEIEDLTNIDLFLTSKEVEESLLRRETCLCLSWCHDNKSKLRKLKLPMGLEPTTNTTEVNLTNPAPMIYQLSYSNHEEQGTKPGQLLDKSTLEFKLRQQEFIELIRNDQRLEAIRHARKYFTNLEDDQMADVQKSMGLLAFPSDTSISPYKELLDPNRWQGLVQQFREDNFKLHQLNNMAVFTATLQAGLSALKTPLCYKPEEEVTKNPDCPVCSKHLNELARPLPFAHCANSRLICNISGLPLNENNPPMMLPNGHVYGMNALAAMASENEGKVVCPRTKQIFSLDEAEKVFVM